MLTLSVHYEPLNSNSPKKCERVVKFLLFFCKRLCTMALGIRFKLINYQQSPNSFHKQINRKYLEICEGEYKLISQRDLNCLSPERSKSVKEISCYRYHIYNKLIFLLPLRKHPELLSGVLVLWETYVWKFKLSNWSDTVGSQWLKDWSLELTGSSRGVLPWRFSSVTIPVNCRKKVLRKA